MRERRLPPGGGNKFQVIKALCAAAEAKGQKLWRLSIGQPQGPALKSARIAAARAVLSTKESMHEYQDNSSPGVTDFARRFVTAHVPEAFLENMAVLPIPGIKPMLVLIPMACGGINGNKIKMYTMTDPGYPTPADQASYLGMIHKSLPTSSANDFRFSPKDIHADTADLLMLNYPHNPSGQVATWKWWFEICTFCEKHNIRLFNDAAYAALAHDHSACTLSEVAEDFPQLSWVEAFSASKLIGNGTGWRVGAMVGSPDFIADIAEVKSNTDSGAFAPAMQGVVMALENDQIGISLCRQTYADRIKMLTKMLGEKFGMKLAVEPKAGFFTLWESPQKAFGIEMRHAEQFNNLMIENTGIVGVPFGQYIRYAVTSPIEEPEWQEALHAGLKKADISY